MSGMAPFAALRVTLKKKGTLSGPLRRFGAPASDGPRHSESSSIRAMSAPSPGRCPILRMRV